MSRISSKFGQMRPLTAELPVLKRLKVVLICYMGVKVNGVSSLSRLFFIRST